MVGIPVRGAKLQLGLDKSADQKLHPYPSVAGPLTKVANRKLKLLNINNMIFYTNV